MAKKNKDSSKSKSKKSKKYDYEIATETNKFVENEKSQDKIKELNNKLMASSSADAVAKRNNKKNNLY